MEYGSDFHWCDYPKLGKNEPSFFEKMNKYASGRQALQHLIDTVGAEKGWRRLWVPHYYCNESIVQLRNISIERYPLLPDEHIDEASLKEVCDFKPGDVLMAVNYFGMHPFTDLSKLGVEVIEDHTHDLGGDWAMRSTADWCFASIRKLLPVSDGGVLWSPRNHALPMSPAFASEYEEISQKREEAMSLKSRYLAGEDIAKDRFLSLFAETEEAFATLPISAPTAKTLSIMSEIDYLKWRQLKLDNLKVAHSLTNFTSCKIIFDATFSLLLRFSDEDTRNKKRKELINNQIYGAVLWPDIQNNSLSQSEKSWSNTMLSLHVDGRYSTQDIINLTSTLNRLL